MPEYNVACRFVAMQRLRTIQQTLLRNGSANKHVSKATIALEQKNGVS
jgi:hypothetical protein